MTATAASSPCRSPFGAPWTAAEDEILRAHYMAAGPERAAALVGRTVCAVLHRAPILGLWRRRRWTTEDDRRLKVLWGERPLAAIAKALDRTEVTTYWRAQKLGLALGMQPGHETLTEAAERTGFAADTLRGILFWAGVRRAPTMSRPDQDVLNTRKMLDPLDVDDAVAKWLACEVVNDAAKRRGMLGDTLAQWLLDSRNPDVPPKPSGKRRWRVPTEVIDQVIAERRTLETMPQAAKRVGITRWTLSRWLDAAGVQRLGARGRQVRAADVDRLVANLTPRQRDYMARGRKGRRT